MAEIIACPNCQRKLQITADFYGQLVQCPDCQHQFEARPNSSGVQSTPPSQATSQPKYEKDDEPRRRDDDDFEDVRISRGGNVHLQAHRGAVVLVLGILSICCIGSPITGIVAWILGHIDLKAMDAGTMDPAGRSQTQTGKVLGMISTILTVLLILGYCLIAVFATGIGVLHGPRRR
jgi:hypothetical protein